MLANPTINEGIHAGFIFLGGRMAPEQLNFSRVWKKRYSLDYINPLQYDVVCENNRRSIPSMI